MQRTATAGFSRGLHGGLAASAARSWLCRGESSAGLRSDRPALAPLVSTTWRREVPLIEGQALLREVIDFYHETLLESPEALA